MTAKSRARKFLKKIHKKEKTNGNPRKLDRIAPGVERGLGEYPALTPEEDALCIAIEREFLN